MALRAPGAFTPRCLGEASDALVTWMGVPWWPDAKVREMDNEHGRTSADQHNDDDDDDDDDDDEGSWEYACGPAEPWGGCVGSGHPRP